MPDDENESVVILAPPLPEQADIAKLLKEYSLNSADMDEARGKIGSLIQHAERNKNIHRKAFKLLTQVEKMDETKRAEFLRHLYHYFEVRGHIVQPDLLDETPADPPETQARSEKPAKPSKPGKAAATKPVRTARAVSKIRETDAEVMDRTEATH